MRPRNWVSLGKINPRFRALLQRKIQTCVLCQSALASIESQQFLGSEINCGRHMQDIQTPVPALRCAIFRVNACKPQDGI
jgi:hypothetical protein